MSVGQQGRVCGKYFHLWVENFFTSSKQALPEKKKCSRHTFDSNIFCMLMCVSCSGRNWHWHLTLPFFQKFISNIPICLPACSLPHSGIPTVAENRGIPLHWVYSFFLIHLPLYILIFILTLRGSSSWSVLCNHPHSFVRLSLYHTFLENPLHCLKPTLLSYKKLNQRLVFQIRKPELRIKRFVQGIHSWLW